MPVLSQLIHGGLFLGETSGPKFCKLGCFGMFCVFCSPNCSALELDPPHLEAQANVTSHSQPAQKSRVVRDLCSQTQHLRRLLPAIEGHKYMILITSSPIFAEKKT